MTTKTRNLMTFASVVLIGIAGFTMSATKAAPTFADDRAPELTGPCVRLEIDTGNKVAFRAYATGTQNYRWNGVAWILVAPDAQLFANEDYTGQIGKHYGGPTWESKSGSKVVATRIDDCTPDTSAIAWLKLQKVTTEGAGIFDRISFIQRVNTTGGLKPTVAGTTVGEEANVPYTAEYYFYRPSN